MTTKQTHTEVNRRSIEEARRVILDAYKLSELEYKMMVFDMGLDFAKRFVAHSIYWIEEEYQYLTRCKESGYWDWWIYRWGMDDVFLSSTKDLGKYPYRSMKEDLLTAKPYYTEANNILKTKYVSNHEKRQSIHKW